MYFKNFKKLMMVISVAPQPLKNRLPRKEKQTCTFFPQPKLDSRHVYNPNSSNGLRCGATATWYEKKKNDRTDANRRAKCLLTKTIMYCKTIKLPITAF